MPQDENRTIGKIPQPLLEELKKRTNYLFAIGISKYNPENFNPLPNARKDIEDITEVLVENYYFERKNIHLLYDDSATKDNILEEFETLHKKIKSDDRLIIYYSGHGHLDDDRGFWIPVDAKRDKVSSYIRNAEVRDIIRSFKARHILLMSDSCFSASLLVRASENINGAFEDWDRNASRLAFISGVGVVSDGQSGVNSPFAQGILKYLKQNQEPALDVSSLAIEVTKFVRFNHKQQAEIRPLFESGHEGGQFIFFKKQSEKDDWETALIINTEGAYLFYLDKHPEGQHEKEAEEKLKELGDEKEWQRVVLIDAPFAYREYLKKYPTGIHVLEAQTKLKRVQESVYIQPDVKPIPKPQILTRQPYEPEMVLIPKGTFMMGDVLNDNEYENEKPVHEVSLGAFYLGKCAVSQREWMAIMGSNPSSFKGDNLPVEQVSWEDIQEYLKKLNEKTEKKYRLPTEAEWEYAAREGGKNVRFGNGKNTIDPSEINFDGSKKYKQPYSVAGVYREKTVEVNSFSPNALGLYNMSGNVWEWCNDWYDAYSKNPETNPKGASSGSFRVLRGGSWNNFPQSCRTAYRYGVAPAYRYYSLGFRVASPLQ